MRKVKRGREECTTWKWARCAELRARTIKNWTKALENVIFSQIQGLEQQNFVNERGRGKERVKMRKLKRERERGM
jgi:hypothetical protein